MATSRLSSSSTVCSTTLRHRSRCDELNGAATGCRWDKLNGEATGSGHRR